MVKTRKQLCPDCGEQLKNKIILGMHMRFTHNKLSKNRRVNRHVDKKIDEIIALFETD